MFLFLLFLTIKRKNNVPAQKALLHIIVSTKVFYSLFKEKTKTWILFERWGRGEWQRLPHKMMVKEIALESTNKQFFFNIRLYLDDNQCAASSMVQLGTSHILLHRLISFRRSKTTFNGWIRTRPLIQKIQNGVQFFLKLSDCFHN